MRNLGDVATMSDNSLQKNSTGFRLPVLDPDFLLGGSMRGVRLQLEYAKAEGAAARLDRSIDRRGIRQRSRASRQSVGTLV